MIKCAYYRLLRLLRQPAIAIFFIGIMQAYVCPFDMTEFARLERSVAWSVLLELVYGYAASSL
jgi:hypothetical protein